MIIGVSGKARSGKDVFAEFLAEELIEKTGNVYVMMAYAHELKCMAQKEFDLSWDQLWGDEKETYDLRYSKLRDILPYCVGNRDDGKGLEFLEERKHWTGREIMQAFGEFYRSIDYNFWVKKLFSVVDDKEYENVIITDCRYPNEIDPVVEKNGYHIRINRRRDHRVHGLDHPSETSLDDGYKIDFDVDNNGTLDDLRKTAAETVAAMLNMEKLRRN